jgi:hypothetical protein
LHAGKFSGDGWDWHPSEGGGVTGFSVQRTAPCAMAHLSDEEAVAKMGHPGR